MFVTVLTLVCDHLKPKTVMCVCYMWSSFYGERHLADKKPSCLWTFLALEYNKRRLALVKCEENHQKLRCVVFCNSGRLHSLRAF